MTSVPFPLPTSHSPFTIANYINGEFTPPHSGEYIDNFSPATGTVISKVPSSTKDDVNKAVDAAKAALPKWKSFSMKERADILTKIANKIESLERDTGFLSQLESLDTGKPVSLAKSLDIPRVLDNFRYFASLGQMEHGSSWLTGNNAYEPNTTAAVNYSQRFPIGVISLIVPWNLPLYLLTWKLCPALLCGNTILIKASELTPLTATALSHILNDVFTECGLPHGIVNFCHGYGHLSGDAMVNHPDVKMVSFTGGSVTGAIVGANCSRQFKRVSLELGGKNTAVVFDDCDFDKTVSLVARSAFLNQGEICLCNSRILVQDAIYDKFVEALVKQVQQSFQPNDPSDVATTMGALISKPHMDKVLSYIDIAKEQGGQVLCGGARVQDFTGDKAHFNDGYFVPPTLIANVKPTDRLAQEEVFGPVVCVMKFSTEAEALEIHNNTPYGLAGSVFTSDVTRAHRYSANVETGMIWVNCWMLRHLSVPFGGVRQSGNLHEGGEHSLDCYSYTKNICIKL